MSEDKDAVEQTQAAQQEVVELPDWRRMWDFGDPAASELRFRDAIAAGLTARNDEYVLVVTTQLARAQGLQRRFDDAHATLDTVEQHIDEASVEVRMRYMLERGRALNSSGSPEGSVAFFERAWQLGQGAGIDPLTADAGHMLAIVSPPAQAIEWSERTMAFCESSDDGRCKGWLGPLYNNTGWTYHDKGEFDKALALWEKSLAFREEAGDANTIFIARWTIGRCYRSMQRLDEALAVQEELHADRAAAEMPGAGYVEEELGECLLALGREDEARPWFAKAYEMLNQDDWFKAEEAERLERLKSLGGK